MAGTVPRYRPSPQGAASWWLLLMLILVASAGFYIWYQQNQATEPRPRPIRVAEADSSGPLPPPDTNRSVSGGGSTTVFPDTTPNDFFVAPSPDFASSRSGPVGNIINYARRMRYDPGRGMEFTLPVDEYGRQRQVRLEPLANLRRLDSLAFAEGRIIARVRSDAALPSLSLHNGESFVWVQGTLGFPIQAEVWSASVVTPPKTIRLAYSPRPPTSAPADKDAFWLGSDTSSRVLWIACGRGWCHS